MTDYSWTTDSGSDASRLSLTNMKKYIVLHCGYCNDCADFAVLAEVC